MPAPRWPRWRRTFIALPFADERSVVQTGSRRTTLTLLRAHLGEDLTRAIAGRANRRRRLKLPEGALQRQPVHLPRPGLDGGPGQRGGVKMREASLSWSESYPRHGVPARTDQHRR